MALAVVRRLTIVRHQHRVASAGIHLRAVTAVEIQEVRPRRPAVDRHDQRIALTRLVAHRLEKYSANHPSVPRLPGDLLLVAKFDGTADPRIGIGELHPLAAIADVSHGAHRE